MKKSTLIRISIIYCLFGFILPFILADEKDSLISIVSTSFTIVGTFASLITLYIAVSIYQKFGIESRFIERQMDKTLQLVDLLKGKIIYIQTENFTRLIRFVHEDKDEFYNSIKHKKIYMDSEDYQTNFKDILKISKSYWLPNSIKENMNFFVIFGFCDTGEFEDKPHVNVYLQNKNGTFRPILPSMDVEKFLNDKDKFISSIEQWISDHSEIRIDFKLNESDDAYN